MAMNGSVVHPGPVQATLARLEREVLWAPSDSGFNGFAAGDFMGFHGVFMGFSWGE